ncbi:efflux RND transporter permease subunit [Pelagibacteraceae bacterium]|nr:efflux RND transporter permease subunit [Pelagibacteraceae bacterium]
MIEFLVDRKRTAIALLIVLIFAGIFGRVNIPIENEPEIVVPVVYVGVGLTGISPQDSERLLLKPIEEEVRAIEGIDKLQGFAFENYAAAVIQFEAAETMKKSLDKVRDAINDAKVKFPDDAKEPVVSEVSFEDQPTVIVSIDSPTASERYLLNLAQEIKKEIELIPSIFEAELLGAREEQLEATLNRSQMENYNISFAEIITSVSNNNQVVTAGEIQTGQGQFAVNVPGLFETARDVYELPIRSTNNSTVNLADISTIKRNFKDRESYTKVNGEPGISLLIKKGRGRNVIDTINEVDEVVQSFKSKVPSDVNFTYVMDSREIMEDNVNSLQGNILLATIFVIIVTMLALGIRSSLIVGSGIPVSILIALFVLYVLGYDYNFMVIFGILVALGMLIDGSLVVVELADRKMLEGFDRQKAYIYSAKRMFWPIVASAATTLAVFIPLFFWPGISGQFMQMLPVTIFVVLFIALIFSLMFVPVIGSVLGKPSNASANSFKKLGSDQNFNLRDISGYIGIYVSILDKLLKKPILTLLSVFIILFTIISSFFSFGKGMIYFSTGDPYFGQIKIYARGNLSIDEINKLTSDVEFIVNEHTGIKNYFLQTGQFSNIVAGGGGSSEDLIATAYFEFVDRNQRKNGHEIISELRDQFDQIKGIKIEVTEQSGGPPIGKDLEIRITGPSSSSILKVTKDVRNYIDENVNGLVSVEDTLPVPLVDWELIIDKPKAAQFGADIFTIGKAVSLVTNGIMIGKYRPDDVDDELEIYVRYADKERSIDQLDNIMIETRSGQIPISNFVEKKPKKNVSYIRRYDTRNAMYIKANVVEGLIAADKVSEIQKWTDDQNYPSYIDIAFGGENEEQTESMKFVTQAFIISILIMAALLVTQFNSFYQSFIILTAVIMSTAGVFFGLLVFNQPFSAIMHGVGVVSLAGIVVNNNIILIDAFNFVREKDNDTLFNSILKACAQRLRPIFLTTITTMLGLIPLAMNYSIDPILRTIEYDSNVSGFWTPLAQCIVYGLSFSAFLTLIVTPCLLILPSHIRSYFKKAQSETVNA